MWVGNPAHIYKKIIIMKKIKVFIILICIGFGLTGCALLLPVWECLSEPYPATYYYYDGCYHTTPPPYHHHHHHNSHHYRRPHKPKVTNTHSNGGHTDKPNSKGGNKGGRNERGGKQGGRVSKR
jgi:hypothetical protein